MNRFLIAALILIICFILFLGFNWYKSKESRNHIIPNKENRVNIKINNFQVDAEIADTIKKRAEGLSGKNSLSEEQGMLFIFSKPGKYSFWMKDMDFPIDIIWINKDLEIVEIKKNIAPDSFPKSFFSSKLSQYVLELKSGTTEKYNIKEGDKVVILSK